MANNRMSARAGLRSWTFATPERLAHYVADWIIDRAIERDGNFSLCLCGGSTPKRLYETLAATPARQRFPWERTHWFWGDERLVPRDDPRSNFRLAWEALLQPAPVPARNIHPIPTEGVNAAAGADRYEAELKRFYGGGTLERERPLFDLTLLGLGEDGHTASLFPGSPVLAETNHWVAPVPGEGAVDRITLTFPAIESSRVIAFIVVGANKRDVLSRIRGGDPGLPAARLRSAACWFVDRAADPILSSNDSPVAAGEGKSK